MTIRSTYLAAVTALALVGSGCGSDNEQGKGIPRAQATELERQLASIQDRVNFGDGACADITDDNEPSVSSILDQVPNDVDPDVRDALRQSFDHLFELTATQCDESKGTETTPTETETTPPEPQQTETQQTETQETQTQETQPQETQPSGGTPPGQQKKKDKGKGKKQTGNGGGAPAPEGAVPPVEGPG